MDKCALAILLTALCESMDKARTLALEKAQSFRRKDKKGRHNPTINMKGVDAILQRHANHPVLKKIEREHAYTTTVFCGVLEAVWKKGVFTTSEILWLRPSSRTLFYTLNQMGGDRPFVEATGPWAHYIVEKTAGQAVKPPCVEAGTDAIQQMLFEEEWIGSEDGLISEVEIKKASASVSNDPADFVTF
jgi:intracellular multiplication protein IcmP